MKNVFYAIITISLFLAWMASPLTAQSSKRITITKEIRQADGSILTETIVKEGGAAEEFDLDEYLGENEDKVENLNIEIGPGKDVTIQRMGTEWPTAPPCPPTPNCLSMHNFAFGSAKQCSPKGFLGVSPINDNDGVTGVAVSIVDNSSAERAGLQRGDRILRIDDTRVGDFDDISDFMDDTKPGQEINLAYERGGVENTITIAVGSRNNNSFQFNFDDDNVNAHIFDDNQKEACLGVYSTQANRSNTTGSRITDFTDNSAAQAAGLRKDDLITAVNDIKVEDHDELWDEIAKYKAAEVVKISFLRDGTPSTLNVGLNPCKGKTETNVWVNSPRKKPEVVREIIVIKRADDASPRAENPPVPNASSRTLDLKAYRAFPNPTEGAVNIEFEAPAEPIIVSLYDMGGRQLFGEEINSFDGFYKRQFDLSAYAASTVVLAVQQGEQVFTEQILVKRN